MRKKGFILLEVILGIYLLGIVSLISLNLLGSTAIYLKRSRANMEIDYIGELAFESLKSKDDESLGFLNRLNCGENLEFPIPEALREKYQCKVLLTDENEYLWAIEVRVYKNLDKGRKDYEEFQGSILK